MEEQEELTQIQLEEEELRVVCVNEDEDWTLVTAPTDQVSLQGEDNLAALLLPPDIFYVTNPKDIREGLAKGIYNLIAGVGIGTVAIASVPVLFLSCFVREDADPLDCLVYSVGGVYLIIAGVAAGAYQVGRGLFNTPYSIYASTHALDWDAESCKWTAYNFNEEFVTIGSMSEKQFLRSLQPPSVNNSDDESEGDTNHNDSTTPSVRKYYTVLGVSPTATNTEIKRAYYQRARETHPDSNPNDLEAQQKFQSIAQAYQTLSDEDARFQYDQQAMDVETSDKSETETENENLSSKQAQDKPLANNVKNAIMLFELVFGSERFIPYIGSMKLDINKKEDGNEDDEVKAKMKEFRQKKRELTCATYLLSLLTRYVNCCDSNSITDSSSSIVSHAKETFLTSMQNDIEDLCATYFSSYLAIIVGRAYTEHALSELNLAQSVKLDWMQTGRKMWMGWNIIKESSLAAGCVAAVHTMDEDHRYTQDETTEGKSGAEGGEGKKNPMPREEMESLFQEHLLTAAWHNTELDIHQTLVGICRRVTHDHSVDAATRLKRVQGLKILGEALLQRSLCGLVSIKELHEELMKRIAARSDGTPPGSTG